MRAHNTSGWVHVTLWGCDWTLGPMDRQWTQYWSMCACQQSHLELILKHRAAFVASTLTPILSWTEPTMLRACFHPSLVASPPCTDSDIRALIHMTILSQNAIIKTRPDLYIAISIFNAIEIYNLKEISILNVQLQWTQLKNKQTTTKLKQESQIK